MKTQRLAIVWLVLSLLPLLCPAALAGLTTDSPLKAPAVGKAPDAIPWDQIGAKASVDYRGDGLAVTSTPDGARLHCEFQRLDGQATRGGLWLTSTVSGSGKDSFRVFAAAFGRASQTANQTEPCSIQLPATGEVTLDGSKVRFARPGLMEEYSVSMDGVQQDFVIAERPAGAGGLQLHLAVSGATVETIPNAARLVLGQSGRKIAYSRLHATDAQGRDLPAKIEVLSPSEILVTVDDAAAEYPVRIDPTFSDANWFSLGGIPGVSGAVFATAVDGSGNVYVGGNFIAAGNVLATNIAEWNGSTWLALGPGLNGIVDSLAVAGGTVFAGGTFTAAGSTATTNVAAWNGSTWSGMGLGVNGAVYALVASAPTNVYAGGAFTTAGSVSAPRIAQWNGVNWSSVGFGVNYTVFALALSGTNLYVGGGFTYVNSPVMLVNYIVVWNGSTWAPLGEGLNSNVSAMAVLGTNLYVAGGFTVATNSGNVAVPAKYVAQWNGSSWSSMGVGMNNNVVAMAVAGGNVFIGGNFTFATNSGNVAVPAHYVAQWNGTSWSSLGVGAGSGGFAQVFALAAYGANVYMGGGFTATAPSSGVVPADNIAQWNGSTWLTMGSGINNSVSAVAVMGNTVYVGGSFLMAGAGTNFLEQWNGSNWSALGSSVNNAVFALAVSGTNLYVGGAFSAAGGLSATNIAEWNGSAWSSLGPGMSGPFFSQVNTLAVSGTNLYVGGVFTTVSGVVATNIALWNGSAWSALGNGAGNAFGQVNALALSGGTLYAGGFFSTAGTVTAENIAQWNGSTWSPVGLGLNSFVGALAMSGGNLYVGGSFTAATNSGNIIVPVHDIAEWNGSAWTSPGLGVNNAVNALVAVGTNLYVGGSFTIATNSGNVTVAANHLALWNGSSWSALGSGVNGPINTLMASGAALYAGGNFTVAGDTLSGYAAGAVLNPGSWLTIQSGVPGPRTNTLTYAGYPGSRYVTQFSTNLATGPWVPLATNTPAFTAVGTVLDTAPVNPQRFYKLTGPF